MHQGPDTNDDSEDQAPRERILVVDDDESIVRMLRDVLKKRFDVVTANSGAEAEALLAEDDGFACVLADHFMPGRTGVEILGQLLATQPRVGRVLLTASERVEDAREAVNHARVHRFVSKPVRIMEIPQLVDGVIREVRISLENERLVEELKRALSSVQMHERELERRVEKQTAELREAMKALEQLALRDGLTGLYNHRFFQEALTTELARAARHRTEVGLIFMDVDHFKNFNDINGHPAGDRLLKQLARILMDDGELAELRFHGRLSDIPVRYGGEEFALILPHTDREGARIRAERLRESIAEFPFDNQDKQPGGMGVTVSVGVASFPADGLSKTELLELADQAMYRAKRRGRNLVCTTQDADEP